MKLQRLVVIATAVFALVFSAGVTSGKGGGGQGGMSGMAGMGGADAPQPMTRESKQTRIGEEEGQGRTVREQREGDAKAPGDGKKDSK